jgi:hypothetical protein
MTTIMGFYAIIFMATIGSTSYESKLALGPFESISACAAMAIHGLGDPITGLNANFPEWQFRVACLDHAPDIINGEQLKLYELNELYPLAMQDDPPLSLNNNQ